MKSGTIFDNVLITDDSQFAHQLGKDTWKVTADGEKVMKKKLDDEEQKRQLEEEKKRDEAKKAEPKVDEDGTVPEAEEAESKVYH